VDVLTPVADLRSSIGMKERTLDDFGARLTTLRQAQGLTQDELGTAVGISNRMIAYYERDGAQPPGAILVELARVLTVSTDTLLGVAPLRERRSPKTARLLKRLQKIEELPAPDQRAILKLLDAMVETRRRATPARTRTRKTG
jgi:transcriptional regulator with XRE-family HTH domain